MLPWRRWLSRRRIEVFLSAYTRAPVCIPERASPVAVYKVAGLCCAWQPTTPVVLRFRANEVLLGSFAERAQKSITSRPSYCHAQALALTSYRASGMKQSTLGKFFGAKTPDAAPPKPKIARAGMGGGATGSASPPVLKEQTNGSEKKRSREASHFLFCQQT